MEPKAAKIKFEVGVGLLLLAVGYFVFRLKGFALFYGTVLGFSGRSATAQLIGAEPFVLHIFAFFSILSVLAAGFLVPLVDDRIGGKGFGVSLWLAALVCLLLMGWPIFFFGAFVNAVGMLGMILVFVSLVLIGFKKGRGGPVRFGAGWLLVGIAAMVMALLDLVGMMATMGST